MKGLSRSQEADLERRALANGGKVTHKPVPSSASAPLFIDKPNGPRRPISNLPGPPKLQGPCKALWIPGWFPTLVNSLRATPHRHWASPYKQLKADKAIVAAYFAGSGLTRAIGPRRVSVMFVMGKGRRLFDRDAPRKSLYDSLVQCGALLGDNPALCYEGPVTYARALLDCQAGTLVLLEEVE